MTSISLFDSCERWRAAQQQELATYAAVVDEIMAGERAGVSEADMVRASGLARMTVRKYRRRAGRLTNDK